MKRIGNQVAMLSMLVFVGGVVSTGQVQASQGKKTAVQDLLNKQLKKRSSLGTIVNELIALAKGLHQKGQLEQADQAENAAFMLNEVRELRIASKLYPGSNLVKTQIDHAAASAEKMGRLEVAKIIRAVREGRLKEEESQESIFLPEDINRGERERLGIGR
jgi:hypothetical protein